MVVLREKGSQSTRNNFQPEGGGHLIPFAFSAGRKVVDLISASAGAWETSPTCQRCSSQSKEEWQQLDMRSTDTKQSNQGALCCLKLLPWRWKTFSWKSWSGPAGPSHLLETFLQSWEHPTYTLKHNLEYPRHQWKLRCQEVPPRI